MDKLESVGRWENAMCSTGNDEHWRLKKVFCEWAAAINLAIERPTLFINSIQWTNPLSTHTSLEKSLT